MCAMGVEACKNWDFVYSCPRGPHHSHGGKTRRAEGSSALDGLDWRTKGHDPGFGPEHLSLRWVMAALTVGLVVVQRPLPRSTYADHKLKG